MLNYLNGCEMKNIEADSADVAASFQQAVIDVLVNKATDAAIKSGGDCIAIAGGVAANSALRAALEDECNKNGIKMMLY